MKYVAFISYSHADSSVAKRLHRWLESYSIPKRLVGRAAGIGPVPQRLRPIFRDREELPTSADLGQQITSALQDSATLIVICSPRAATSRWVNEEILAFKRLGRSGRIFCLIVDGEPNATDKPGTTLQECFPPALRFQLADDGNLSMTPAEPIAADMRAGKDGRRDAWLKLAAGIAGVGFDELKQRELQRQLRRALVVSATSVLLLLTMAGLTVAAVVARREAVRQRLLATAERDRAEQNFRDARNAVDRFYTKVSEETLLHAEGLQPLRAQLLEEALEYYRRFLSQRKDDQAFALEAALVQGNVGAILSEVGTPEEALVAQREATLALERLRTTAPADPAIASRLSESLGNEAVNLHRLGRVDEALVAHNRAIEVFETLPTTTPERKLVELQRLLTTKGAFEAQLGRFADAARSYERSLEVAAQIQHQIAPLGLHLEPAPGGLLCVSVQQHSPAAVSGIRVGNVIRSIAGVTLAELTQMADVRKRMKVGEEIAAELIRAGEEVRVTITPVQLGDFMTASTKYNLGYLYLHRLKQPDKAKPWLAESVDEYRRTLLDVTANAADVRDGLAFAAGVLGTCGYELGDVALQEEGMREAVMASKENVQANPGVPRYRTTLAVDLANLSTLIQSQGTLNEAEAHCREAAEQIQMALETGGDRSHDRFQLVQILTNLADITEDLHGPQAAIPVYDAALQAAEPLHTANSLPQSLLLILAKIHRCRASSLRTSGRLKDSAAAYEEAHRLYAEALVEMEPAPARVLQDSTTLECWRAALLHELKQNSAAEDALTLFEARCATLQENRDGLIAAIEARAAAVSAFADAAARLLPADRLAGEAALRRAETQLEKAAGIAIDEAGTPSKQQLVDDATNSMRSCRLRAGLCSENRGTAWREVEDFLAADRIAALSLETRLDLAASLIVADEPDHLEAVIASINRDIADDPDLSLRVRSGIDTARRCGIPDKAIARLKAALQLPEQDDAP